MVDEVAPETIRLEGSKPYLRQIQDKSADNYWLGKVCANRGSFRQRSFHKTFEKLWREVDPDRPYFFGELSNGIRFSRDAIGGRVHTFEAAPSTMKVSAARLASNKLPNFSLTAHKLDYLIA